MLLKVYIGELVTAKQNSGVSSSTRVNKFNLFSITVKINLLFEGFYKKISLLISIYNL